MKMFPMYDNVLVVRSEVIKSPQSILEVPNFAKEKTDQCRVVALGLGRIKKDGTRSLPTLKVGDNVLISKFSGVPIKIGKHTFISINETNILGVITE